MRYEAAHQRDEALKLACQLQEERDELAQQLQEERDDALRQRQGTITVAQATACISCSPGRIRPIADDTALGPCTRSLGICQPWEHAVVGLCEPCETGQVSWTDSEATPTHEGCSFCPDGQVRSSADGQVEGLYVCSGCRLLR
jgi:hypothetical protein